MKKEKQPLEHWVAMISHIDSTWRNMKKVEFGYPFQGRDFRDLRHFAKVFKPWGVMSLWDAFLASDGEWVKRSGYSIGAFISCLPWLVDIPGWKDSAAKYEKKILGNMPPNIQEILEKIIETPK